MICPNLLGFTTNNSLKLVVSYPTSIAWACVCVCDLCLRSSTLCDSDTSSARRDGQVHQSDDSQRHIKVSQLGVTFTPDCLCIVRLQGLLRQLDGGLTPDPEVLRDGLSLALSAMAEVESEHSRYAYVYRAFSCFQQN